MMIESRKSGKYSGIYFLLLSCLGLVSCNNGAAPVVTLRISGDMRADSIVLKIFDLDNPDTVAPGSITLSGLIERDISADKEPLQIRLDPSEQFRGRVMLCGIAYNDTKTIIMSAAKNTHLNFGKEQIIELQLRSDRRDNDGDCYSPDDENFWDCSDSEKNPTINAGAKEICNDGIDNNCDGRVDEDCPCVDDTWIPCFDEEHKELAGIGACTEGKSRCKDGKYGPCEGAGQYSEQEICGNNIDDNCNGVVDDGCECIPKTSRYCWQGMVADQIQDLVYVDVYGGKHQPKGTDLAYCSAGIQYCSDDGHWEDECSGAKGINFEDNGIEPYHELRCDGIDNDCDGQIDENDYSGVGNDVKRNFDADSDGYNQCGSLDGHGNTVPPNMALVDCDDHNPYKNPGVVDRCDDDDDLNCDGKFGLQCPDMLCGNYSYYAADSNGNCYKSAETVSGCDNTTGQCKLAKDLCTSEGKVGEGAQPLNIRQSCQKLKDGTCTGTTPATYVRVEDMADPYGDCAGVTIDCSHYYYGWINGGCYAKAEGDFTAKCYNGECTKEENYCAGSAVYRIEGITLYNQPAKAPLHPVCNDSRCEKFNYCLQGTLVSDAEITAGYCAVGSMSNPETTSACSDNQFCDENSKCVFRDGAPCDERLSNQCNPTDSSNPQYCKDNYCLNEPCDSLCEKGQSDGTCGVDSEDLDCTNHYDKSMKDKNTGSCKGGRCQCTDRGKCDGGLIGSYCESNSDCLSSFCGCGKQYCNITGEQPGELYDGRHICLEEKEAAECTFYNVKDDGTMERGGYVAAGLAGSFTKCLSPKKCNENGQCVPPRCNSNDDCSAYNSYNYCVCADAECSYGLCQEVVPTGSCRYKDTYNMTGLVTNTSDTNTSLVNCDGVCVNGVCKVGAGGQCETVLDCQSGLYCNYANYEGTVKHCMKFDMDACHYAEDGSLSFLSSPSIKDGVIDEKCNSNDKNQNGDADMNKRCYQGQCTDKNLPGEGCSTDNDCASNHCECNDADCEKKICRETACDMCKWSNTTSGTCTGIINIYKADEHCRTVRSQNLNCEKSNDSDPDSWNCSQTTCNGAGSCRIMGGERCYKLPPEDVCILGERYLDINHYKCRRSVD